MEAAEPDEEEKEIVSAIAAAKHPLLPTHDVVEKTYFELHPLVNPNPPEDKTAKGEKLETETAPEEVAGDEMLEENMPDKDDL